MYAVCQGSHVGHSIPVALMTREADERGPIAIFWDIENCGIPSDVPAEVVAANMKRSMRTHPETDGAHYRVFSAYGDFALLPKKIREGCQRTGVSLVDVPSGRKDAADRAIMADYFFFAMDNRPPASILLITGDVDFAHSLHKLGARGYQIFLAAPAYSNVSPALLSAASCVWDWPSMARGQGLLPYQPPHHLVPPVPSPSFHLRGPPKPRFALQPPLTHPPAPTFMPPQVSVAMDSRQKLKAITNSGFALSPLTPPDREAMSPNPSSPEPPDLSKEEKQSRGPSLRSMGRPGGKSVRGAGMAVTETEDRFSPFGKMAVEAGSDSSVEVSERKVGVVTSQLVQLVRKAGGRLPLLKVPSDYRKCYGRPLTLSDYGCSKMFQLVEKMMGAMAIEGEGTSKELILKGREGDISPSTKKSSDGIANEMSEKGEVEERSSVGQIRVVEGEGTVARRMGGGEGDGDGEGEASEGMGWTRDEETEEEIVGMDRKWTPFSEEAQSAEERGEMKQEEEEVEGEGLDLPVIMERQQGGVGEFGGAEAGADRGYGVDVKEEEEEEEEEEDEEGQGVREVRNTSCEKMLDELRRRQKRGEESMRQTDSNGWARFGRAQGYKVGREKVRAGTQESTLNGGSRAEFLVEGKGKVFKFRPESQPIDGKLGRKKKINFASVEVERECESEGASIEVNLQELLLAYGGQIQIGEVRKAYKLRYGQPLDDSKEAFGSIICRVGDLRTLVDPVSGLDGGKIYLVSR